MHVSHPYERADIGLSSTPTQSIQLVKQNLYREKKRYLHSMTGKSKETTQTLSNQVANQKY